MKEEKEKLFKSTEARNHDVHGGMLWSGIKKEGPGAMVGRFSAGDSGQRERGCP